MASQSRRTEKTAMPKASPSPDATKSALLQTLDALLKKHDALSATEDTELKDQLKTSITEGKTQLCDDLAAWAVTRRRNSEPERPEKETAAICGLIAAIDHELKAEERECWKDDGEIGPLQTALKTYAEVFGTSNANTNTRKYPWKPQMYTRMEENDGEGYESDDDKYHSNFGILDRADKIKAEMRKRNREAVDDDEEDSTESTDVEGTEGGGLEEGGDAEEEGNAEEEDL